MAAIAGHNDHLQPCLRRWRFNCVPAGWLASVHGPFGLLSAGRFVSWFMGSPVDHLSGHEALDDEGAWDS